MEFVTGLVSVTFRSRTAEEIAALCRKNRLEAIEWGGDVHVPAGETDIASAVGKMSRDAGLTVSEYGSYYRIGKSAPGQIEGVVSCAERLGTRTVRIWAYDKKRADCTGPEYENAVADARRICSRYPDITFCLECHPNTLTEEYQDAEKFLNDAAHPNLRMFWQPNQYRPHADNLQSCRTLLPYIRAVHVFSWERIDGKTVRFPLAKHTDRWAEYLEILKDAPVERLPLMLEFMHDDRSESLQTDAETLRNWVEK